MTKRAVRKSYRSGTRPCAICQRILLLVEHHINGRDIPNAEAEWNKVRICASCHDCIHAVPPRIIIEGWFRTTSGRKLFWHERGESPKLADGGSVPLYGTRNF